MYQADLRAAATHAREVGCIDGVSDAGTRRSSRDERIASLTPAPAAPAPEAAAVAEPQALVSETSEREITVDTATVQAVLTNRGGRLLHWRLKDYRDNRGEPVDLVPSRTSPDRAAAVLATLPTTRISRRG